MRYTLVFLLSILFCISTSAQNNKHLLQLNAKKNKIDSILGSFSGQPETIELLINEGNNGLNLTRADENEYRFIFLSALGTGFYYRQDFKAAMKYFEQSYQEAVKANLIEKSLKPLGHLVSIYHYIGLQNKADEAAQT